LSTITTALQSVCTSMLNDWTATLQRWLYRRGPVWFLERHRLVVLLWVLWNMPKFTNRMRFVENRSCFSGTLLYWTEWRLPEYPMGPSGPSREDTVIRKWWVDLHLQLKTTPDHTVSLAQRHCSPPPRHCTFSMPLRLGLDSAAAISRSHFTAASTSLTVDDLDMHVLCRCIRQRLSLKS